MDEDIRKNVKSFNQPPMYVSETDNYTETSSTGSNLQNTTSIDYYRRELHISGSPLNMSEDGRKAVEFSDYVAEEISVQPELKPQEGILDQRENSLESVTASLKSLSESDNISSQEESSKSDESEKCSQVIEMYQLTNSEEDDISSCDDDAGGDYTVSKYMQSKIFRPHKARFGVWRVEKNQKHLHSMITAERCIDGISETAGTSQSTERLPPLKLTLKKSLQEPLAEEIETFQERRKKKKKKKYKTNHCPSEQKDPLKRRGPGRPPNSSLPKNTTRQRLMNMFKKKYFKNRKRWARAKSAYSMPPTIRSIAKP